jgi:hypothetical protein
MDKIYASSLGAVFAAGLALVERLFAHPLCGQVTFLHTNHGRCFFKAATCIIFA